MDLQHPVPRQLGRAVGRLLPALIVVLATAATWGQTATTGAISGVVTDQVGAAIVAAKITVRGPAGALRSIATNSSGAYTLTLLPPGHYSVSVEAPGMSKFQANDVTVQITETTTLDAQLRISKVEQTVKVTGTAPLLQATTSSIGQVIGQKAIIELPLVNRNYTQLLGLTPGVNTDIVDATQLGNGSQEIRTNGSRAGDNNFMINGGNANNSATNITQTSFSGMAGPAVPAPDAIEEFKVQTSLYDAEYGRASGAVVDVVTKSGTNGYHGDVYYFGRNAILNANNFFANRTGTRRGKFIRNQPGFTLGGPIIKNRLTFFASYQNTQDVNAECAIGCSTSLVLPPIPADRSPASLGALFGGQTGLFGGTSVAPNGSNINPVALTLLNLKNPDGSYIIPSPQITGPGVNYSKTVAGRGQDSQFNTNLDFNVSSADRLSLKFFRANSSDFVPFFGAAPPGFGGTLYFFNRNFTASWDHVVSPRILNHAFFAFSRIAGNTQPQETITDQQVGTFRPGDNIPEQNILSAIGVAGEFSLAGANPFRPVVNNFQYSDLVSIVHGNHNLKFGFDFFRDQFNQKKPLNNGSSVTFLSFPDFLLGLPAGPAASGGNGTPFSNIFVSLLLPLGQVGNGVGFRQSAYQGYVQDDWKIKPNLTLNLGARLEDDGRAYEVEGRTASFFSQFYKAPPAGAATTVGDSGFCVAANYTGPAPSDLCHWKNNMLVNDPYVFHAQPRVGFSWQPFPDRIKDLVVRGGYGIFVSRLGFEAQSAQNVFGPPFFPEYLLVGADAAGSSFQSPFPNVSSNSPDYSSLNLPGLPYSAPFRLPRTSTFNDPAFQDPVVQNYTLGVQYQLKNNYLISIAYDGAKGTHLPFGRSNNQPLLASPTNPVNGFTDNSAANASQRVPFVGLTPGLFRIQSGGNSIYNALEASLTKRFSHGVQLLASYTYSRSIDNAADSLGIPGTTAFGLPILGQFLFNDQNNPAGNRGPSDFDRPHRFVLSGVWDLPSARIFGGHSSLNKIFDGWTLSGVGTVQSGTPFSILDSLGGSIWGGAILGNESGSLAPGRTIASAQLSGDSSNRVNKWFDTSAFVPATSVNQGYMIDGIYPVGAGGGTLFGNLGRNVMRGPAESSIDLAFGKTTKITEKMSLLFRWEAFNLFNHANFANPGNNVSDPNTFGVISGLVTNPRIMQYAIKLIF